MKRSHGLQSQRGVTLIIALVFLVALMLVGLSAAFSSLQEERFARNGRDFTLAAESAEAALRYVEGRVATGAIKDDNGFAVCSTGGVVASSVTANGLCKFDASGPLHVFLNSNLSNSADTVTGAIASSAWSAPYSGMMTPRFVVEVFPGAALSGGGVSLDATAGNQSFFYRITGRGFGLNQQINVTLESIFRPYGS
ncbi:PilX N-terminal domain-containing pilus assembly protein [uncultured Aquitalea sp.]|uniref:pilus assembly PilX family protein n=1 Tax=uncultured Aquitalea sp. TaxID=540272 RepID=UPI0025D92534|nr:PilX N-terminal domain-containing pilus assembly protein [uncultured Aquitalea sp.]